jgi:hypothetical protein
MDSIRGTSLLPIEIVDNEIRTSSYFELLPAEITQNVFSFLNVYDLGHVQRVSDTIVHI